MSNTLERESDPQALAAAWNMVDTLARADSAIREARTAHQSPASQEQTIRAIAEAQAAQRDAAAAVAKARRIAERDQAGRTLDPNARTRD